MATATIHAEGLNEALGNGFSFQDWLDDNEAILTTEHTSSSYGHPVLVKDGRAYGPADLPGVVIYVGETELTGAHMAAAARAAGWTVKAAGE